MWSQSYTLCVFTSLWKGRNHVSHRLDLASVSVCGSLDYEALLSDHTIYGPVKQKASKTPNAPASAVQHCDTKFSDPLRETSLSVCWSGENLILPLTEGFPPWLVSKNSLFHAGKSSWKIELVSHSEVQGSSGNLLCRHIQVLLEDLSLSRGVAGAHGYRAGEALMNLMYLQLKGRGGFAFPGAVCSLVCHSRSWRGFFFKGSVFWNSFTINVQISVGGFRYLTYVDTFTLEIPSGKVSPHCWALLYYLIQ